MEDIIEKIANKIKDHGGKLYLIGGAIRDKLLSMEVHDEDYCVVGMESKEFEKLFKDSYKRGKSFQVYDLYGKEFAMARTERKIGKGHKNFEIISNKDITIIEDLKRRDITINAIAQDVLTKEIIDPFNGIDDINNKKIRAVSENFKDDPLRVYRVARFASKLLFEVEENTIQLMHSLKNELEYLSSERVFDEFRKAINTKKPSIFFDVLKKADVLDIHFKEIYKLIGAEQPVVYHPEGDAYNHTMLAVDMASTLTTDEKIRFSALVHDLGKGVTPKEEYPHHKGHDEKGVKEVEKLGARLKMPNSWIKCGKTSAKEHMRGGIFYKMTIQKRVEFIERISKTVLGLDGLEIVVESDRNCRGIEQTKVEFAEVGKEMINQIDGKYIIDKYKILPGIKLKEKLHEERVRWLKKFEENKTNNPV